MKNLGKRDKQIFNIKRIISEIKQDLKIQQEKIKHHINDNQYLRNIENVDYSHDQKKQIYSLLNYLDTINENTEHDRRYLNKILSAL